MDGATTAARGTDSAERRGTVVVLLVALAIVAAALAGPFDPSPREVVEPVPPPEQALPTLPVMGDQDLFFEELDDDIEPLDLTWVGVVLGLAVVALLAVLAVRWAQRRALFRRGTDEPEDTDVDAAGLGPAPDVEPHVPTVREGVDDAVAHLAREGVPRDVVIAAWVALEDAAGRSGVLREPAQTPTEFTLVVLDRTPADRDATRSLLDLYLRARFGEDLLGADDVARAAAAADDLARSLTEAP